MVKVRGHFHHLCDKSKLIRSYLSAHESDTCESKVYTFSLYKALKFLNRIRQPTKKIIATVSQCAMHPAGVVF